MNFEQYLFSFFIYSFLGYICEVIYCSICQRKLVNRGYLYMPICPIYGFGAIIIIFSMTPIYKHWYLVLILGILLTSLLEYITSYVMELIFHMRWWDYSKRKFNINGRVCLRNSLMFGALVIIVMYLIHPLILNLLDIIGLNLIRILNIILIIAIVIDLIFSTIKNINLSKILSKINVITDEAGEFIRDIKESASEKIQDTKEYLLNTKIIIKIKKLISKYPNVSLRKVGKEKKRLSISEFISKHFKDKEDK